MFYRSGKPKFAHFLVGQEKDKKEPIFRKLISFVFGLNGLLKSSKKAIYIVIFDVKFPVESNRPNRIFRKLEENPENVDLNVKKTENPENRWF